jgi:two-component system LytT family response regulator
VTKTNTPSKLRAIIVDDEPLARRTLRALLRQDPEIEIGGECADGLEAVEVIRANPPDIVFLDVQMPEMSGLEVLEAVAGSPMPAVVFVTAYDQYALKAFEVNAADYLLKPFDDDRFWKALRRAKEEVRQKEAGEVGRHIAGLLDYLREGGMLERPATAAADSGYLHRIAVRSAGHVAFVKVAEIDWIEAAAQYVQLHIGNKGHLMRESIHRIESRLDPALFFRVHRSALVNLERVKELQRDEFGGGTVVLQNGARIRISRSRREQLEMALTRGV